jgi:hypothetical protein
MIRAHQVRSIAVSSISAEPASGDMRDMPSTNAGSAYQKSPARLCPWRSLQGRFSPGIRPSGERNLETQSLLAKDPTKPSPKRVTGHASKSVSESRL